MRALIEASGRFGYLLTLALSLVASAWLALTEVLSAIVLDALGEVVEFVFAFGAIPVFLVTLVWSLVYLLNGSVAIALRALPLVVAVSALTFCSHPQVDRALDRLDFDSRFEQRAEVVEQISSGALWSGSPRISIVFVPPRYPPSVSGVGGQRGVVVFREDDALHVAFWNVKGLLRQRSYVVYRSDGKPPSLPTRYLRGAYASERLADSWYRVLVGW